jgi:hypothetical protein
MVGRCAGAAVTPDYAGYHPWASTGGTIKKVIVDVSGEAYVDLENEAIAAFKRDQPTMPRRVQVGVHVEVQSLSRRGPRSGGPA